MTNTKFVPESLAAETVALMCRLPAATPVEVDTVLAKLHGQHARVTSSLAQFRQWVHLTARSTERTYSREQRRYVTTEPKYSTERCVQIVRNEIDKHVEARRLGSYYPMDLAKHDNAEGAAERLANYEAMLTAESGLERHIMLLDAQWRMCGRWPRTFLVTSSTGHLHSSTHCSTCRPTTTYGWWPELSGLSQAELIEQLGDHADALCSVCYPDAPVASKRSRISKTQATKLAIE